MIRRIGLLVVLLPCVVTANAQDWHDYETIDGHFVLEAIFDNIETKARLELFLDRMQINMTFLDEHEIFYDRDARFDIEFMGLPLHIRSAHISPFDDDDIAFHISPQFDQRMLLQVDYTQQRLRYLPRKSVDLNKHHNWDMLGISRGTTPSARVEIAGEKFYVSFIEPKASYTTVRRSLAEEYGWIEKYKKNIVMTDADGEELEDYDVMLIPDAKIGPFEFDELVVLTHKNLAWAEEIVTDKDNVRLDTWSHDGVIGLDVMQNFVITVNIDGSRLHVYIP